ncbi:MAG: GT4 family glycosyltransferase PelF [Myxococcales bacterium]|nr:GT4 family glycosyltransferase PelF [Myxococcales bacterium]
MRVLQVMNTLEIGGAEALVLNLARRIDTRRFALEIASLTTDGTLGPEFRALGLPTHVLDRRAGRDPLLPVRLAALVRRRRIDVIHSHNVGPWLYGGLAAAVARRPLVHTEHSNLFPHQKGLKLAERALSLPWLTHTVVADAERVKRKLVAQGIDSSRVRTIMNGIDTNAFTPGSDRRGPRERLGLEPQDLVVGTVGRLVPVKDQACLLEAFARTEVPHARLVLVGDGPLRRELEDKAQHLGIGARVVFAGGRRDVADLLPAFDVFVLSSKSEGLPLTVLEAMASGLPVVATDVGALAEAVIPGRTGRLVPPENPAALAEALTALLKDREMREGMAAAGLARARAHFDLGFMTREYQSLYEAAVAS